MTVWLSDKIATRQYAFKDSKFTSAGKSDNYVIENSYLDDRLFKIENSNKYILCDYSRDIYWITDLDNSYVSGISNSRGDIFERGGVFINEKSKVLNYRTSKCCSTAMHRTFYRQANQERAVPSFFKYNINMWRTKKQIQELNLDDYFKFAVVRDPIERFYSQVHFLCNCYQYIVPRLIKSRFKEKYLSLARFLMTVMEANQFFKKRDEFHMSHQFALINDICEWPDELKIDCIVDLKNISRFVEDKLKFKFIYASTGGKNEVVDGSMFSEDELDHLRNNVLRCDYEFIEKYKDLEWK